MISCYPCFIRIAENSDYCRLEQIYLKHEGTSIPKGYFDEFRDAIRDESALYLVAEVDHKVVGGGGICNPVSGRSTLMFGIVDPEFIRKGIGTSILLTRIQFLANLGSNCQISLQATESSSRFFEKLGFNWYQEEIDESGHRFLWGENLVKSSDRPIFLHHLNSGGVTIAPELLEPPHLEFPD